MSAIASLARALHGGTNVYRSRLDCLKVLHAVAAAPPPWWNSSCTAFVQQTEALTPPGTDPVLAARAAHAHPIILIEGLDGTGKTLITRTLAEKLGGVALSTPPPEFATLRESFRGQEEAVARAFYSAANYIAAQHILAASRASAVVVDRWWTSTCAMALANHSTPLTMPPAGDAVYAWPDDLARPDAGFLLCVEEATRVARIRKRAPEDAEERRLSAQLAMRQTAMEAYHRTGMLTDVPAPTYGAAVNAILQHLHDRGLQHSAAPFTRAELDSIAPF